MIKTYPKEKTTMNSKIYICFYIFIFLYTQKPSLSYSENNTDNFKSKEELILSKNQINTYSDPDSMVFGVIKGSDFFEPKENLQKSNNLNAKKWTITIKLGPFNTKNDAQKIPSNLRTDSSKILFESNVGLPKANLYEKVLNFNIAEVESSKNPDKKQTQNNFKNTHAKNYEKNSASINSNYIIEIKTDGLPLRVRESPTTTSPIIYRLKNGSKFISVDKPRYDETGGWVRIEYLNGEFGWISKTYAKITDFVESEFIDNKFTELKPSPSIDNFNIDQVNNWIKAWESKNFKLYLSFYSNNFKGTKESRQSWEESREHSLKKYLTIDIEAKSIHIARSGNNIKVSFIQLFKSDKFSDIGNKVLYWENQETGWKIVKEVWSPL